MPHYKNLQYEALLALSTVTSQKFHYDFIQAVTSL